MDSKLANTKRSRQPKTAKPKTVSTPISGARVAKAREFYDHFVACRNGGVAEMKKTVDGLRAYLSDPTKKPSNRAIEMYNKAVQRYEQAVKASIGMPTYSDSVTLQHEAPKDIPTLPLDGFQLVQRTCLIEKLAALGSTAGGFYANLIPSDIAPFTKGKYFRVRKVTSWTGTTYGNVGSGFAGVQVPVSTGTEGTEVMPMWSENWTPIGQGYAGIVTQYPLGDFPQIDNTSTIAIVSHYTALGGTGGVTGVPVIFHVEIECLI